MRSFKKSRIVPVIIAIIISTMAKGQLNNSYHSEFVEFEKEFGNSISIDKDVVKVIGFITINMNDEQKGLFRKIVNENRINMDNVVVANDSTFYRTYIPFHTAIVEYNGNTYTADEKGVVLIPDLTDISQIKVIGRKRSETVHGTENNIIEEDRILFKQALTQEVINGVRTGYSIDGHICVFDMGDFIGMN